MYVGMSKGWKRIEMALAKGRSMLNLFFLEWLRKKDLEQRVYPAAKINRAPGLSAIRKNFAQQGRATQKLPILLGFYSDF